MIVDVRGLDADATFAGDVAIMGAGAAGIILALELAEAGQKVVLVEAGGAKFSTASQEFYRAETVEPPSHGPIDMFRRRVLGGSTSVWGGRCIPFDPIDFEERHWIAHSRWPLRYEDVARHYPKALEWLDAGPPLFTAGEALPGEPGPMAPGVASTDVILDRIERFSHPMHLGAFYRRRLEQAALLTVLINAPVRRILTQDAGAVATGLEIVREGDERPIIVRAPRVVVCAGGLETARILLSSDHDRVGGLGNGRDLVGRFYQCHLEGEIGEISFTKPADAIRQDYQRSPQGVYCRRYIWLSPEAQRRERLAGLVLRPSHPNIVDPGHRHPVLSAMYLVKNHIVPEYARKLTSLEDQKLLELNRSPTSFWAGHLRNIVAGSPKLLAFTAKFAKNRTFAKRKLPSVVLQDPRERYPVDVNGEQEPNRESRVTLGTERDALGMRRIRLDWRTTSDDHDRLVRGLRLLSAALAPSGSVALTFTDADYELALNRKIPVGGHHIGTARMADSPAEGVCDGNGEVFGTKGLFLAGAATFSTSGFANPTLTLVALTLRLADLLRGTQHDAAPDRRSRGARVRASKAMDSTVA